MDLLTTRTRVVSRIRTEAAPDLLAPQHAPSEPTVANQMGDDSRRVHRDRALLDFSVRHPRFLSLQSK